MCEEASGSPCARRRTIFVARLGGTDGDAQDHSAAAPAPFDMPFNLVVDAEGFKTFRLRQVLVRPDQPNRIDAIKLQRKE